MTMKLSKLLRHHHMPFCQFDQDPVKNKVTNQKDIHFGMKTYNKIINY